MLSCAPPFCKEPGYRPVNVARPPISHARSAEVPHDPLTPSEHLARLAEGYLTSLYDTYPTTAASLGLHDYDGRIPDIRDVARAGRVAALRAFRTQLAGIPPQLLDVEDAHDHTLLSLALDEELFELEQLREFERNPMAFSGPLDVSGYIKRNYAPLPRRVVALCEHLRQVPDYLAAAREALREPVPLPFLETALEVYAGTVLFQEEDLVRAVRPVGPGPLWTAFERANTEAIAALRRFTAYLEAEIRPRATQEFAIGEAHFQTMLSLGEMIDLPVERLLEIGRDDLSRNQAVLRETAKRIDPGADVRGVMSQQAKDHPPAERLIPEAERLLEELKQFVESRRLVSIPSAVRPRVEETPPFARWAFAMMDTSGPFETAGESFYYVTPPEPGWTPEQKEEWLRKFDYATLRDVGIHEVYPGHYVHFLHVKEIPRSLRRVLTSYSFVEGWAHYCEEMLVEEGYGRDDPGFRIAQCSEALLRDVRFLVAIEMHTRNMSKDTAARMFVESAYLDPLPAEREAARGTFDPGYLNYTLGKLMIRKLRDDLRRRGAGFSLRAFHDGLLKLGAPPIPLIRRRLLATESGAL
ncbi:MAG: DUF885 domain-containing protein [Bacillati bacterium ANGP1]|uniref:DUF885 domain-containing protein n=1 Tax=Candidatus Segetimicrobium genomatis TaxID=2569760 RepID=A0A537J6T3_9BACT|nr:MAG: DUF885 domain-containing protein [Terrabacteria group bacterium ANGP1]